MDNKRNYYRALEWTHTFAMVHPAFVPVVAKLEAESGIDVEDIAKGVRLQCKDDECELYCSFQAYGTDFSFSFSLNPAGDRFRIGTDWCNFDDKGKVLLLRRLIFLAMRGTNRAKVQRYVRELMTKNKEIGHAALQKDPAIREAFEKAFAIKKDTE